MYQDKEITTSTAVHETWPCFYMLMEHMYFDINIIVSIFLNYTFLNGPMDAM